ASHLGYTAVGEQVGMAQRMEAAAPPGGVLLSESTARLVEDRVVLAEPEMVRIKGVEAAVPARRRVAADVELRRRPRHEGPLVGRHREMGAVTELLDQAAGGDGTVIAVTGRPGVGKTTL